MNFNINNLINKSIKPLFNIIILLYLYGAVFAPIAKYFGFITLSEYIYYFYGFFCHQKPERSIFILGNQMAFCSRDFGIFFFAQIIGILSLINKIKIRTFSVKSLIIFSIPLVIDGGIQLLSEILSASGLVLFSYESTNLIRVITGGLFGIGLSLYIFTTLTNEFDSITTN